MIIFIVVSELLYMVASHQQLGLIPYPIGATIFCYLTHLILLVTCIWYCGWIAGIILFLCDFLGVVHATIGWIFMVPTLFYDEDAQFYKLGRREVALLTPALLVTVIFCITSFFVVDHSCLLKVILDDPYIIIVPLIIILICSIIRIYVFKKVTEKYE